MIRRNPVTAGFLFVLTVLAFAQQPGKVTFDTKIDLAVNPIAFLARSLHLWNPAATSGELQNQAYGYLFPMGPFFALGQLLDVPVWITQRLWCALLLGGAFLGVLLLSRALKIGSEPARHVAALAYALAPRMLTEIGTLSAEMLSAVMLPWVLLPLVRLKDQPRRAAALSALAVLGMGGVNAAVVLTALVIPGIWLLTRRWTAAHVKLVAWWGAAVAACVLWWLIPLLLLGRYSLPFLSYIESSADTTSVASLFQAVRGTNQWVAYVVQGVPWWPSGWMLVDNPILMVATMLVAAVGLAGLARPGLPERGFLVLATLAGLLLLTVGYVGTLDSPLSNYARELLDGPLAPFRNVHKFEPVIRLPLVLGFAHGIPLLWIWLAAPVRRVRDAGRQPWLAAAPALALVAVVAAPAWLGALRPGPGWTDVPEHWRDATAWLGRQDSQARTLVVPASGFGNYTWGRTVDEPIQPLAEAPWALRNQVPLGSEGNTRVMDAVNEVLESGVGSAGLADFLARSGYRYLLLRNDIDRQLTGAPPVSVLRQSLTRSPGITLAASFGPAVSAADETSRSPVDYGTRPVPAIEIYEARGAQPVARTVPVSEVATVSGGPESLLPLLEQGLIERDRPAVLAGDAPAAAESARWLVTDGLRRRERNIGRVRDNLSQTLTATETPRQNRPALDILPYSNAEHQTVAAYAGVRQVSAATSAGYADALGATDTSHAPFAAIDGDPRTAWHSSSFFGPIGQWFQVDLDTPRQVDTIKLELVDDLRVGWTVNRIRITTDAGSIEQEVPPERGAHEYDVVPGLATRVRITVLGLESGRTDGNVGIRELTIPDASASRALRVPDDARSSQPVAFAFSRGYQDRAACFRADDAVRCDPGLARLGEEARGVERLFRTTAAATYTLSATAVALPGGAWPVRQPKIDVTASSWLSGDPAVGAGAAVDGNRRTAWLADIGDGQPALRLRWSGERDLDEIRIRAADAPAASMPTLLELRTPKETRLVRLGEDGRAQFPSLRTDRVDIVIMDVGARALDLRGDGSQAPAGIAELEVPDLADLLQPIPENTPFTVPCGQGPVLELAGQRIATSVQGPLASVTARRPLRLELCGLVGEEGIALPAGEHHLTTQPSAHFVVQDVTLRPAGLSTGSSTGARPSEVARWGATARAVRVESGDEALLVIAENANAGWVATLDGKELTATRVDGWQQAFVVPAGAGGQIELRFAPDREYRMGLAAGALAALLVVFLALLPVRQRRKPSGAEPSDAEPSEDAEPSDAEPSDAESMVAEPSRAASYALSLLLVAMAALLGGFLPVALVVAALLVRQLVPRALPVVAFVGAALAMLVAVSGRLSGHGQAWAYGRWAQAAMLIAICVAIAATIRLPGDDPEQGRAPS